MSDVANESLPLGKRNGAPGTLPRPRNIAKKGDSDGPRSAKAVIRKATPSRLKELSAYIYHSDARPSLGRLGNFVGGDTVSVGVQTLKGAGGGDGGCVLRVCVCGVARGNWPLGDWAPEERPPTTRVYRIYPEFTNASAFFKIPAPINLVSTALSVSVRGNREAPTRSVTVSNKIDAYRSIEIADLAKKSGGRRACAREIKMQTPPDSTARRLKLGLMEWIRENKLHHALTFYRCRERYGRIRQIAPLPGPAQ